MSSTLNSSEHTSIPSPSFRHELTIPTIMIRNPSISKLMILTTSPATPSPVGASQLRAMVSRLEDIDIESRALLKTLFSMLNKDAQLEKYLRKKRQLEDGGVNKVSRMWELVEQVLDAQKGELDQLLRMLDTVDDQGGSIIGGFSSDVTTIDKGLKMSGQDYGMVLVGTMGDDDSAEEWSSSNNDMRLERFKFRTLDNDTKASGNDAGFR